MSDHTTRDEALSTQLWRMRIDLRLQLDHRLASGEFVRTMGTLEAVEDLTLRMRTPRGEVAMIRVDDVSGYEEIQMASFLGLRIDDLERMAALHWKAPQWHWLGSWWLQASGGFTGRANSVLVLGDPGMPVPEALDTVKSWYRARGLPPVARVAVAADAPGLPPTPIISKAIAAWPYVDAPAQLELRAGLERLGWVPGGGTSDYCLTAPVDWLYLGPRPAEVLAKLPDALSLDVADDLDQQWLATYTRQGKGVPSTALTLLKSAPRQAFFSIRTTGSTAAHPDGPQTVAVARGSVVDRWARLTPSRSWSRTEGAGWAGCCCER